MINYDVIELRYDKYIHDCIIEKLVPNIISFITINIGLGIYFKTNMSIGTVSWLNYLICPWWHAKIKTAFIFCRLKIKIYNDSYCDKKIIDVKRMLPQSVIDFSDDNEEIDEVYTIFNVTKTFTNVPYSKDPYYLKIKFLHLKDDCGNKVEVKSNIRFWAINAIVGLKNKNKSNKESD